MEARNLVTTPLNLPKPDVRLEHELETEFAQAIQLKVFGGKAVVWTYYHPVFIEHAKTLKGEWDQATLSWHFTDKLVDHLSVFLQTLFHVDGKQPYAVCRLRIHQYSDQSYREACMLFGRPIVRAVGRERRAFIQPDIYKLSGSFRTGGSRKNWRTVIEDSCFEIHKFPMAALKREDVELARQAGWLEVLR